MHITQKLHVYNFFKGAVQKLEWGKISCFCLYIWRVMRYFKKYDCLASYKFTSHAIYVMRSWTERIYNSYNTSRKIPKLNKLYFQQMKCGWNFIAAAAIRIYQNKYIILAGESSAAVIYILIPSIIGENCSICYIRFCTTVTLFTWILGTK